MTKADSGDSEGLLVVTADSFHISLFDVRIALFAERIVVRRLSLLLVGFLGPVTAKRVVVP